MAIAPDMNGSCSTELISLKVSQYFTVSPYRSKTVRQYRSKQPTSSRLAQPLYFLARASGVS